MSENNPHPIVLLNTAFVRSVVIAIPTYDPNTTKLYAGPTNNLDVLPMDGKPGHFSASMRSTLNLESSPSCPYLIDMEAIGFFQVVDTTLKLEEATRGVLITANSVLYGAIREAVAWLTARQPNGPLMLSLSVLQHQPATNEGNKLGQEK